MRAAARLILPILLLTNCDQNSAADSWNTTKLEKALSLLNEKEPEADAKLQFDSNGPRIAGCWGEPGGPFFPGISETEWIKIRQEKRFWTIDGTTDAIESRRHSKLIDRAWAYAESYKV